ncbi:MAG: LytR C-terminal domain-containing protein [Candidatus Cloacimonetes bacterium]|nr:LytR C-terminal domain-containing protein [Candidatus Cloacimonadota bacterium]MDD2210670.1 LytR C-terminal domain-containing protein [Candidatus Cloacimonadota bacterium]MDD4687208.1 LytR C-terminal domain-containing protein [Candidatus Cloacimonadota bacterium]
MISRSLNSDNKLTNYDEDQLPAIKVLVLNGCGYEQLATEFSAHLANKNIDVISVGDTPKPIYDKSIIVMRKEDKNDLERLMRMTGIQRWTSALNEYHNADFDIIVGRDYEEFMK